MNDKEIRNEIVKLCGEYNKISKDHNEVVGKITDLRNKCPHNVVDRKVMANTIDKMYLVELCRCKVCGNSWTEKFVKVNKEDNK